MYKRQVKEHKNKTRSDLTGWTPYDVHMTIPPPFLARFSKKTIELSYWMDDRRQ
jgi:hypothetical protein